jgi:hypothetical protein
LFVEKATEGNGFGRKSADTSDGVVINVRHDDASLTAAGETEEATGATAEQREPIFDNRKIGMLAMQVAGRSKSY